MRSWTGILVGQGPGSEVVSFEAHPSPGGVGHSEGLCLAHHACSVDAHGMTE